MGHLKASPTSRIKVYSFPKKVQVGQLVLDGNLSLALEKLLYDVLRLQSDYKVVLIKLQKILVQMQN